MTVRATVPLGQRLRDLRHDAKLSQHDMGHLVGTNQSRICDWETGRHKPQLKTLTRYAQALGITVSELLEGVL
jgi:transcriptional regulator with XRE-family HTH domain